MRSILVALVMLGSGISSPAWSQWMPTGPYTFVQGQTYDLEFTQPALENFLAADIFVRYPSAVFEPISLLPGSLASMLSVDASPPTGLGGGVDEVYIAVNPSNFPPPDDFGIDLPDGSMFGVRFKVRDDAPLGGASPSTDFTFLFGDPPDILSMLEVNGSASIAANIVAVPEADTWAMMLAALGMIGFCAARRCKTQASI